MKNLLTTLMVLLIAISAAAAVAGDMDWKFYGQLHNSIDYMSDGGDDANLSMSSNSSRFGFKGGMDLDEDLAFIWQFESDINVAEGGGTLAMRNSYVGLKKEKIGAFVFGRHDTPFKTLGRKVEFFKDELGDHRQMTYGWDRRAPDVVAWVSPDWSGFGIFGAYVLDQAKITDKSITAYSLMAHYGKDAFFVGAAIEGLSEGATDYNEDPTLDPDADLIFGDAPVGIRAAAKYDADKFAVSVLFQSLTDYYGEWVDPGGGADWTYESINSTTFGLEALFRFSEKFDAKGSYFMGNHDTDAEDVDGTDLDESDTSVSMLALGVDYHMVKNVKFYLQMVMITNGDWTDAGLAGTYSGDPDDARLFANGHGTWTQAATKDNGALENPMGFSLGTIIQF